MKMIKCNLVNEKRVVYVNPRNINYIEVFDGFVNIKMNGAIITVPDSIENILNSLEYF